MRAYGIVSTSLFGDQGGNLTCSHPLRAAQHKTHLCEGKKTVSTHIHIWWEFGGHTIELRVDGLRTERLVSPIPENNQHNIVAQMPLPLHLQQHVSRDDRHFKHDDTVPAVRPRG